MRKTIFGGGKDGIRPAEPRTRAGAAKNAERAGSRHYVYLVSCSDGSFYTGYTTDPERRVAQHNRGTASKYTRSRLPVVLAYLEEMSSRSEALKREASLKRLKKEEKLLLCRTYSGWEKHGSR